MVREASGFTRAPAKVGVLFWGKVPQMVQYRQALVVELADTQVLGTCALISVEVQILSRALIMKKSEFVKVVHALFGTDIEPMELKRELEQGTPEFEGFGPMNYADTARFLQHLHEARNALEVAQETMRTIGDLSDFQLVDGMNLGRSTNNRQHPRVTEGLAVSNSYGTER